MLRLAITVEVIPATNFTPRKWRASVEPHNAGGKRRSLICDDPIEGNQDPSLLAAIALIEKLGWEINLPLHKGSLSHSASVFVFENPQEI
jgi:hypothetical protein